MEMIARYIKRYPMVAAALLSVCLVILSFKFSSVSLFLVAGVILLFFGLLIFKISGRYLFILFCTIIVGISMLASLNHINTLNSYAGFKANGEFIVI